MLPIQQSAIGLASLLQVKSQGDGSPESLAISLQPVLEMAELYLQLQKDTVQLTFADAIPVVATTRVITVPAAELWYVHAFGGQFQMPAAGTVRVNSIRFAPDGGSYDFGPPITVTANELGLVQPPERGFWALPGEQLGFRFASVSGVSANVTNQFVNVVRTRLRV